MFDRFCTMNNVAVFHRLLQPLPAPVEQAERLGIELAERLLAAGAGEILAEVYGAD